MILSVHNLLMLAILTIVIGAVLSSRLYLKAHRPEDVFGGFIVGLISQLAAFMFFLN